MVATGWRVLLLVLTAVVYSYLIRSGAVRGAAADCNPAETPIACASFVLGQGPAAVHAVNLALHLGNAWLALLLFAEWMPPLAAFLGALWFAVHPLQAEAVTLASGRTELLAALMALVAIHLWRKRRVWLAAAAIAGALACGPAALAIPVVLIAVELSQGGQLRRGLPALGLMLAFSVVGLAWVADFAHAVPVGGSLLSAAPALGRWTRLLALPLGLSIWPVVDPSTVLASLAWMTMAAMVAPALTAFRNLRSGFWFVAALALALPGFWFRSGAEAAADRHFYLPMLAVGAMVGRLVESTRLRPLLAFGALLFALLTLSRGGTWRSEQAMWEEASQQAPLALRPRLELAGRAEPRRALEMLLEARYLMPHEAAIPAQLGALYLRLGMPGQAIGEFGKALAIEPGRAEWHLQRGYALTALKLNDAALTDFEVAVALDPCSNQARAALHLPPQSCKMPP
jgi:protein O-mannosyl-transferase